MENNEKMILFRADGNKSIATGHIMRCLSIAESARSIGYECCFVLASDDMQGIVENKGFRAIVLETEYTDMESEIVKLKNVINELSPEIMILDSYYVTEKYMSEIKNSVKLAYIDDLFSFPYPADVLINYNIFSDEIRYIDLYKNSLFKLPLLLLGTQYAPLRKEFSNIRKKYTKEKAENILVLTGGTDNSGISLNIAEYICSKNIIDLDFHFVIGRFNVNFDKLQKYQSYCPNIHLYVTVTNMSAIMNSCDIAVSASGSTLYELCACGIPTITYILADNQIEASKAFTQKGIMSSVGDVRNNSNYPELLMNEVLNLKDNFSRRKLLSEKMQKIVNPNGAYEIIRALT